MDGFDELVLVLESSIEAIRKVLAVYVAHLEDLFCLAMAESQEGFHFKRALNRVIPKPSAHGLIKAFPDLVLREVVAEIDEGFFSAVSACSRVDVATCREEAKREYFDC